jgi:hypothetical protein
MTRAHNLLPAVLSLFLVVVRASPPPTAAAASAAGALTMTVSTSLRGRSSRAASVTALSNHPPPSSSSTASHDRFLQKEHQQQQAGEELPGGPGVFLFEIAASLGPATDFFCSVTGERPTGGWGSGGAVSCSLSPDGWYGIVQFNSPPTVGSVEVSDFFSQGLAAEQMWRVDGSDVSSPSFDPSAFPLHYAAELDATLAGTALGQYFDLDGFRIGFGSDPRPAWWIGGDDGFWVGSNATGLEWAQAAALGECQDVSAACVRIDPLP